MSAPAKFLSINIQPGGGKEVSSGISVELTDTVVTVSDGFDFCGISVPNASEKILLCHSNSF